MITRIVLSFTIFLAPLLTMAAWKIRKTNREVFTAQRQALPFAPTTKPVAPAFFLPRLSTAERYYLLQQLKNGAFLFGFGTWFFSFILALPIIVPTHTDRWLNPSALVWFQFLRNGANSSQFTIIALFGCVFMVVGPLRFQAEARFHRTRPVSIGLLFWSRVLTVLVPIVLAAATGIVVATLLLVVLHGPVWQNLPAHIPRILEADDGDLANEYLMLLVTSAPRIFVSILTTILLLFTVLLALGMVPGLGGRTLRAQQTAVAPVKVLYVMAFFPLFVTFAHFGSFHLPAILFIYTRLGPPPPAFFALVPVALSIGCLFLARISVKYLEL